MYNEQKVTGALIKEKSKCHNWNTKKCRKVHRSETSTHSQRGEEIERGCDEEREDFLVPIFSPPRFIIVRMLVD